MRAVVQRVSSARVTVADRVVGEIGPGLLILLGITHADTLADGAWLAAKLAKLRIFPDASGQMNLPLTETGGTALVVSQFTLHARTAQGSRPSFNDAAPPALARPLYETFITQLGQALARPVATGEFGATMAVALVNDGPVTLVIDTQARA